MKRRMNTCMGIPVLDTGGSHVNCSGTGQQSPVTFKSAPTPTPDGRVRNIRKITSTGTRDPAARDVLYVEALAAPDTINTLPEKTPLAFAGHGEINIVLPADEGYAEVVIAEFTREAVNDEALAPTPDPPPRISCAGEGVQVRRFAPRSLPLRLRGKDRMGERMRGESSRAS